VNLSEPQNPGRPAPQAGDSPERQGGSTAVRQRAGKAVVERTIVSAAGGTLVFLAFAPAELWILSYVALVPVFVCASRTGSYREAALCGAAAGVCAYLPGLAWLSDVTIGGWVFLALYVAAYVMAAAVLARFFAGRRPSLWPLLMACAWVGLEIVRANFATGFPWFLYGYTQYRWTALIQIAAVIGAYGVSFLVVFVNAALARTVLAAGTGGKALPGAGAMLFAAGALVAVCAIGGDRAAPDIKRIYALTDQDVRALSPEQVDRLNARLRAYWDGVFGRIRDEIDKAARLSRELEGKGVDLLVWPETTVNEPLNPESAPFLGPQAQSMQQHAMDTLRQLGRSLNAYLCIGAPYLFVERMGDTRMEAYGPEAENNANSAYFFSPHGRLLGRYDKVHLVPFGEYVPLRDWLPFLQALTPMTRQLTPGDELVVFDLPFAQGQTATFGVLICYEDVFASLARKLRRGPVPGRGKPRARADFLINITDEGWYRVPGELKQHLAMAVFRAVETRTTVVRAANTGVSCFINPRGELYRIVQKEVGGRIVVRDIEGSACAPVLLCDSITPYTRAGDWFAWLCLVLAVASVPADRVLRRRRIESPGRPAA